MWFKLASANFENNNLGKMSTLSTTWPITKRLSGFTETTGTGTSVDKGAAYNATFTLNSGETYKSHSVTMNGSAVTSGVSYSGGTLTVNISAVTGPVVITTVVENVEIPDNPTTPTTCTLIINATPSDATITLTATGYSQFENKITVPYGTSVTWKVNKSGYITQSGTLTVTENKEIPVTLEEEAASTTATLTVNRTPSDANVTLYAKGYSQSGTSITVPNNGTVSPTYQVYKDNYLSQGGMISGIKTSQTLDITLQPFSAGNWTDISSTAEKVADYFVVDGTGRFNGPYSNWCHWIIPATPGKKYRITATAGQSARLWGFYTDKPVSDGSVKPISVSSNSGMTVKIADEVVAPEGTVYLVVNNRIGSSDTKAIIEVLN